MNNLVNKPLHGDEDIQLIAAKLLTLGGQIILQEYKSKYRSDEEEKPRGISYLASAKKPHLGYIMRESMGLYDLQSNIIGYPIGVKNDELKYQSIAHNLQARISYRHSLGETFTVEGVWVTNDNPHSFSQKVSLKMDAMAWLLLAIWDNSRPDFYAPSLPLPPQLIPEHRLEYGEWSIEVNITGDGIEDRFEGIMIITEARGPILTRKDYGRTKAAN